MILFFIVLLVIIGIVMLYLRRPLFGSSSKGERLERIRKSPQYRNGKFQNQSLTPMTAEGHSLGAVIYNQLFKKIPRLRPEAAIPSVKTDLKQLPTDKDVLVWFGHSSYFMQLDGIKFLVDPVFSGNASPLPRTNKSFPGSDIYTADDIPDIDCLLLTHDHYDHTDYPTLVKLRGRIKKVICGLGVGAHLERWGYPSNIITETDWFDEVKPFEGITIISTPARHFSGRSFRSKQTLWQSFVVLSSARRIYVGGDSGYDTHFSSIGDQWGPFDLAILDNGQYNAAWRYIHMLPAEVLQAGKDLKAKQVFPVHSSKFVMAQHAWDEPLTMISALNREAGLSLVTPRIGELMWLGEMGQVFEEWWTIQKEKQKEKEKQTCPP